MWLRTSKQCEEYWHWEHTYLSKTDHTFLSVQFEPNYACNGLEECTIVYDRSKERAGFLPQLSKGTGQWRQIWESGACFTNKNRPTLLDLLPGWNQSQSPFRLLFQQLLADLDHRVDQGVQGALSRRWVLYLLLGPADSMKLL